MMVLEIGDTMRMARKIDNHIDEAKKEGRKTFTCINKYNTGLRAMVQIYNRTIWHKLAILGGVLDKLG